MLDTRKLSCPQCQGGLTIRRQNVQVMERGTRWMVGRGGLLGKRKTITHRRRYLYCRTCREGWRIQKVCNIRKGK